MARQGHGHIVARERLRAGDFSLTPTGESKMKKSPIDQICTPEEAGAILNLSTERVLQFCRAGRIVARKLNRQWVLELESVRAFAKIERKAGVELNKSRE